MKTVKQKISLQKESQKLSMSYNLQAPLLYIKGFHRCNSQKKTGVIG
jgi:hypothetical protein